MTYEHRKNFRFDSVDQERLDSIKTLLGISSEAEALRFALTMGDHAAHELSKLTFPEKVAL